MDEQNVSSREPSDVVGILPEALPSSVKEAVTFLKPTELNRVIERLRDEVQMKNDIIQTQKLEMQKKDEEIRQLKQQLEAAEEVKESQHSNAYYPSIAHSRGHAELQDGFESRSLVSPKPMPQNEPQPAHNSQVKEVSDSWAEQSSAADTLPISHMVTGNLLQISNVLLDHKTTMATDLWSEVHRYTTKSELMKGKAEPKCKIPNRDELYLEIEHACSDGHVPNFDCPELGPTLQKEFEELHKMGFKGKNIAVALMGPKWNSGHVKYPQNIIAKYPMPNEDSKGHINGELLLKFIQFLIPDIKLVLCQTTIDDECLQIERMITNEVVQWITKNQESWKVQHNLEGIFICIPYGGGYNACEDKVVNDATASGIHLVCAAGCKDTGIVYPAALGIPFCCGAADEHNVANFSPHGRELDFLTQGFVKYGRCCLAAGTACSALIATAKLVILVQYIVQTAKCAWPHMAHLKEILLLSSESKTHSHVKGYGILEVNSIIRNILPDQMKIKLEHITNWRDRLEYKSDCDTNDANSDLLVSMALNAHWKENNKSFPTLKGNGIIIAVIDDDFYALMPNNKQHCIISGADLVMVKGIKNILRKSHGLQCAMVIAIIAPEVKLLLVNPHKEMFKLIKENHADVLSLSAPLNDTYDFKYSHGFNSLGRICVVVCAAGNEGSTGRQNTLSYPARCGNGITIGGCCQLGKRLDISSFGREMDFMAPARCSIADPSGAAGTSLAAPAAAAQIALILEYIDQTLKGTLVPALNEKNEWEDSEISKLARNTHLMRTILRCPQLQLCQLPEHDPYTGQGMLLISDLCTVLPETIRKVIEDFYYETRDEQA